MDSQNNVFTQNLDSLFSNLEDFTRKESVLGSPVTYGDKTLIPIVSVTLGYGSGNSATKAQGGAGQATAGQANANTGMGALGLGAKISTDAVVLINKDNVSVLPISDKAADKSAFNQMLDKLPQMLMGQQQGQQQGQQGQQSGQAQQNQGQKQ